MRSPISRLSHDVLVSIFEINTTGIMILEEYDEDRPLNDIRAASQVCRKWRTLLLDLPKIWGRLIDLGGMVRGKSEWWEEVLRRTQLSPLWITGIVPGLPTEEDDPVMEIGHYFIRLLKSWDRIQKIDVKIRGEEVACEIKDVFLSPAPLLEEFVVSLEDFGFEEPLYFDTLPGQPLFANHAPSLVTMKVDRIAFHTDSPWLANLREIEILIYMEVPAILQLLSHTPLLETMSLGFEEHGSWDPFATELTILSSRIDLPHLSAMWLTDDFSSCAAILDRVSPAKNCALSLGCIYKGAPAHIETVFMERLTTYIINYFTSHSECSMEISIKLDAHQNSFVFEDYPPGRRSFFNTRLSTDADSPEIIVSVIQAFIASNKMRPHLFKKVTKLRVQLNDIPNSPYPDIYDMLLMFQSIEHLVANEQDIHSILKLSLRDYHGDSEPAQPELFPSLHTLEISQLSKSDEDDILLQFLERRRGVGLTISKLDLINVSFRQLRDLRALQ